MKILDLSSKKLKEVIDFFEQWAIFLLESKPDFNIKFLLYVFLKEKSGSVSAWIALKGRVE